MGLVYFNGPEWIDIWPVFAVKIMGHTKSLVSWARKLHYTQNFNLCKAHPHAMSKRMPAKIESI